ncbi:hypothetical protein CONLIGDRAFT_630157 [Coniochaeta ligniaria NRRL 30616]|uniref:Uncharacterized protein n=1 Tax=Coniochaeta ligniaria NRRL 30616 TaxID=1408157 RepID=A0A1J7JXE5_9PEZI|nr:hypothetical protein CONLIGDRAFT_630157 [Coniochaeta ligniaria NRRL 30616]
MADTKKNDANKAVTKLADIDKAPTQHPITLEEMTAARDIFAQDLNLALKEQQSSGTNGELEARIAELKAELETLEREIKSSAQ